MNKRQLGNSQLHVAPLALGGNVFGWTADKAMSFKLLDAFVDSGLNLVDTADVYTAWIPGNKGGESETIIGEWFKQSGKRDKVVLATKCGFDGSAENKNLKAKYIKQAFEKSLLRLQTDRIDLYQAHGDDPQTPLHESLQAFTELVQEGKTRCIGASNYSAQRLMEALDVSRSHSLVRYESLQPLYNLCDRAEFEEQLAPLCMKENIGVITYFSLARGFLSGKYRSEEDLSQSPRGEGVRRYMDERGQRILRALDVVAQKHHANATSVSLAWLMARPAVTAAIASATNLNQLSDLVKSTELQLDDDDMSLLTQASEGVVARRVQ